MEKSILTQLSFSLFQPLFANTWLFPNFPWPKTMNFQSDACLLCKYESWETKNLVHVPTLHHSKQYPVTATWLNWFRQRERHCVYYLTNLWLAGAELQDILMWHVAPEMQCAEIGALYPLRVRSGQGEAGETESGSACWTVGGGVRPHACEIIVFG